MIAFVGLGNPGNQYSDTKHNAGFWVADELAHRWKINFQPGKGEYLFAEDSKRKVLLVKPTTGMNRSGIAMKDVVKNQDVNLIGLHAIVDDVDLPLGKIRIRPKGGDGCHKGMESIIYHLGNTQFPRIRFGIATDENLRPSEKYVLKSFRKKDQILADEMEKKAADAVESIIHKGLSITMNKFNSLTIEERKYS